MCLVFALRYKRRFIAPQLRILDFQSPEISEITAAKKKASQQQLQFSPSTATVIALADAAATTTAVGTPSSMSRVAGKLYSYS